MKMKYKNSVSLIALGIALAAMPASAREGTSQKTTEINIKAQRLDQALNALARQAGFQVLTFSEDALDIMAKPLQGRYTSEEALDFLLGGTDLSYEKIGDTTFSIRSKPQEDRGYQKITYNSDAYYEANMAVLAEDENRDDMDNIGFEEIIVTAQKKEQSLIDVPISLTVIGGAEIEALRVEDFEDYVFTVPNVSYGKANERGANITLRGIGGNSGGHFSTTLVTVDGGVYGLTDVGPFLSSRAFDIERVEILRGPQGTLTGASAIGGVINIITHKPDTEAFEFKATADYSRYNTLLLKTVVNMPVNEKLALRTSAFVENSDGAVRNIGPTGGTSGFDSFGGRLALRFKPTEQLTIDASVFYEEKRQGLIEKLGIDYRSADTDARRQERMDVVTAAGGNYFDTDFIENVGNNGGNVYSDLAQFNNKTNRVFAFRASYEMEEHTIDVLFGHFDYHLKGERDRDTSELAISRFLITDSFIGTSAEFRVASGYDGPFNWIAGVSYVNETGRFGFLGYNGDGEIGGVYTAEPGFWADRATKVKSIGVFTNVFWDITERLHLSAGVRFSKVDSAFGDTFRVPGPDPLNPVVLVDFSDASQILEADLSHFDPRVALNYDITDTASVYVTASTGYRPGYANESAAVGLQTTNLFDSVDIPAAVGNETAISYEVGLKGGFFDNKLSVAAAVFYTDYRDLQVWGGSWYDDGQYFSGDINAGEAFTRGFEIETAFRPLEGLELRANIGYVQTRLQTVLGEKVEGDASIADIRPWTTNFTALYEWDVADDLIAHTRVDYTWQSKTAPGFAQGGDTIRDLPSFNVLDMSIGISSDSWTVSAYFENVFDEKWWLGDTGGASHRGLGQAYFVPRTFGIRFTYRYGE